MDGFCVRIIMVMSIKIQEKNNGTNAPVVNDFVTRPDDVRVVFNAHELGASERSLAPCPWL